MENIDTLFYFCVIIASTLVVIWAIWYAIVTSPTLQDRQHNKSLAALAHKLELARQQKTLAAVAEEQKAHHANQK